MLRLSGAHKIKLFALLFFGSTIAQMQKGQFRGSSFACEMWDLHLLLAFVRLRAWRRIYMKIYYCTPARRLQEDGSFAVAKLPQTTYSVSYTHLTLPTIYSV